MSGMSRRDLLRASAGAAAVAVPMSALAGGGFAAASSAPEAGGTATGLEHASSSDDVQLDFNGPVMFCVRDVQSGEVSILHGMQEVIVKDRQLVNRIVRAAQVRRAI
jgi:hypothetical protein